MYCCCTLSIDVGDGRTPALVPAVVEGPGQPGFKVSRVHTGTSIEESLRAYRRESACAVVSRLRASTNAAEARRLGLDAASGLDAATVAAQKERLGPTLPAGAAAGDGGSSSSSSNPFASSEEDEGGFGDSGLGAAFGDAGAPAQLVVDSFANADAAAVGARGDSADRAFFIE